MEQKSCTEALAWLFPLSGTGICYCYKIRYSAHKVTRYSHYKVTLSVNLAKKILLFSEYVQLKIPDISQYLKL